METTIYLLALVVIVQPQFPNTEISEMEGKRPSLAETEMSSLIVVLILFNMTDRKIWRSSFYLIGNLQHTLWPQHQSSNRRIFLKLWHIPNECLP